MTSRPLVELRVEREPGGDWRTLVVEESTVLHCLHRIVQHAFKPTAQDTAIDKAKYAFSVGREAVGAPRGQALDAAPLGAAFLGGRQALRYVVGGAAYRITACKRGRGDARHYVPRCVAGPPGVDLDAANGKLLVRRYTRSHANNRQKKRPPAVWVCKNTVSRDDVWAGYMRAMRQPVGKRSGGAAARR